MPHVPRSFDSHDPSPRCSTRYEPRRRAARVVQVAKGAGGSPDINLAHDGLAIEIVPPHLHDPQGVVLVGVSGHEPPRELPDDVALAVGQVALVRGESLEAYALLPE
ncbi:unnamed protein product, partial [Clonostachys rhizophaga]